MFAGSMYAGYSIKNITRELRREELLKAIKNEEIQQQQIVLDKDKEQQ